MFCLVKFFQAGYGVNRLSGKPACKSPVCIQLSDSLIIPCLQVDPCLIYQRGFLLIYASATLL